MLKNGFRICPRINDLGPTLTWIFPLNWLLADNLSLCPVGFAFLSGLSLHVVEFPQQHALVIELMDVSRSKVKQRLVRSGLVVGLDVTA